MTKPGAKLLGLLLAAVLCSSCGGRDAQAALVGFRSGTDPHQLVLAVETGPQDTLLGGKVLREDDQAVVVEALMHRAPDVHPLIAVRHQVTVNLKEPLGQREVRAPSGRVIPLLEP
jgi:hypothetical protein